MVVVTTSALSAFEQAWASVDMGGTVVLFAVPGPDKDVVVPLNDFWRKEIRILTSYYCGPVDIEASLAIIGSGALRVADLVTHRLPLKETPRAFQLLLEGEGSMKVIIRPQEE